MVTNSETAQRGIRAVGLNANWLARSHLYADHLSSLDVLRARLGLLAGLPVYLGDELLELAGDLSRVHRDGRAIPSPDPARVVEYHYLRQDGLSLLGWVI